MKFSKKLTAAAAIVAAGFATNVAAETATDTINVYAGLAPALELTCTDVAFGVWRVPVRSSGDETVITLTESSGTTTATPSTNTDRVALKSGLESQPEAGQCSFTGSSAPATTNGMSIAFATTGSAGTADNSTGKVTSGNMTSAPNNEYANLNGANTPAALTYSLDYPLATDILSNGTGSFVITGTLTIPETIVVANYGAYKQDGTITVTIDDGVSN